MSQFQLSTERLILRSLEATDFDQVLRLIRHPLIVENVSILPTELPEQFADDWIKRSQNGFSDNHQPSEYILGIFKETQLIGHIGLHLSATINQAEIGYWLDPDYQGYGYATEACQAILKLAFTVLQLEAVNATCSSDNLPSEKLLLKLGMTFNKEKEILTAKGIHRRSRFFSLTQLEYSKKHH